MSEPIYTKKEAAQKLRVGVRTLERRMGIGGGTQRISYFRDGSRVFFAESHIEEYRQSTLVENRPMKLVRRQA